MGCQPSLCRSRVTVWARSRPCESVAVAVAEEEASAVGGVDVEAGAVGGAEVGDVGERVDEAGVGGAGGGGDEEWGRAVG